MIFYLEFVYKVRLLCCCSKFKLSSPNSGFYGQTLFSKLLMQFRFLIYSLLLFSANSFSQDLKITEIDNHLFPTIRLSFELNESINLSHLKLFEQGKETQFKIDLNNKEQMTKAIFYLLDINRFTPMEGQNIFDALSGAVTELKPGTLINIGFILAKKNKACLVPLSYEFTKDLGGFTSFASKKYFLAENNNKATKIDCALLEAIRFMQDKKTIREQKEIILLTKDLQNIAQANQLLKKGANKYHIDVKLVAKVLESYVVEPANFYPLKDGFAKQELVKQLVKAAEKNNLANLQKKNRYRIEFTGTQNGSINPFKLQYLDQSIKASYTKPGNRPYKTWWPVPVIAALLVVLAFYARKQIRLKKQLASLKETVSLLFDKRVKIMGKQTLNPVIEISLDDKVSNFHIKKLSTTLGRGKDCDLKIEDLTISSHHASITKEGGEFYIKDHGSTNGVFVNDVKIDKRIIKNGDVIRLGKAVLMIHY